MLGPALAVIPELLLALVVSLEELAVLLEHGCDLPEVLLPLEVLRPGLLVSGRALALAQPLAELLVDPRTLLFASALEPVLLELAGLPPVQLGIELVQLPVRRREPLAELREPLLVGLPLDLLFLLPFLLDGGRR